MASVWRRWMSAWFPHFGCCTLPSAALPGLALTIWLVTTGAALLGVDRRSLLHVWTAVQEGLSACGLLYLAAVWLTGVSKTTYPGDTRSRSSRAKAIRFLLLGRRKSATD